jgi:polysaccharide biosynthesis/export protein
MSIHIRKIFSLLFVAAILCLSSCRFYRQDIMFQTDGTPNAANLQMAIADAEANYKIRVNDFVELKVHTNDGELIIDPTFEFRQQILSGGGGAMMMRQNMMGDRPQYLVQHDGFAKLPMVGMVQLAGLTHQQADSVLEIAYNKFYEASFVIARVANRRVFILGGVGGGGAAGGNTRVFPLINENVSLIEVLAQSGGVSHFANVSNIRLIRGDLKNPKVQIIDLSTIEGMRRAELAVMPNDIIYVEPGRRPVVEAVRDYSPFISLFSSLITLYVLISRVAN